MFEESVDSFVARWRNEAVDARFFSRVENDPLLEFEVAGIIMQVLERTGPYLPRVGPGKLIVHAVAESLEILPAGEPQVEVTGPGRGRVRGSLVSRDDPFVVVDAGFRLVVGVREDIPAGAQPGAWVAFEIVPPAHGFVMSDVRHSRHGDEV